MLGLLKRRAEEVSGTEENDHESVDTLSCRFTGTTSGYYEIWLVNLLVTICSLGLMRPWAEARRRQYFYAHTWLGRHALAYTDSSLGSPLRAATGLSLIVLIGAVFFLQPSVGLLLAAVGAALYPWYRHHATVTRAASTTYRGRCFSHRGDLRDSYIRLLGWPLLTVLMAFVPLGRSLRSSWGHKFENYYYGDERFSAKFAVYDLWRVVGMTLGVAVAVLASVLLLAAALIFSLQGDLALQSFLTASIAGDWAAVHYSTLGAVVLMGSLPYAVWRAQAEQLLMSGVRLDAGICFDSQLSSLTLSGLYVSNAFAIALSAGLAIPWAAIRVARYRASVTTLLCYSNVDDLAADRAAEILCLQLVADTPPANDELSAALDAGEFDLPAAA